MKNLGWVVLMASLALAACGKKAVKDESSSGGTSAPVVSVSPIGGNGAATAKPPGPASPPGAQASAGQAAPASPPRPGVGTGTGTGTGPSPGQPGSAAGSSASSSVSSSVPSGPTAPSGGDASRPPGGGGQGTEEAARAAPSEDGYVPGKVAAVKPLEGLPSTVAGEHGGAVPPTGPAAGLLAERSVYFDFDSNEVAPAYAPLIEAHAKFLADHPSAKVILQGNTDERGSTEYNLALGERRADAVRRRLELLGVADNQIETVSYGSEKPKDSGHGETAWKQNRRADIVYRGE